MKPNKHIFFFVLLISIIQALFVFKVDFITFVFVTLSYLLIYFLINFYKKKIINKYSFKIKTILNCYLILGIIAIVRGVFTAANYWEWREIITYTGPVLLLPIIAFIGQNITFVQLIFRNYIRYSLVFSIVVYFFAINSINSDGFARFLSPIYFIIIFFPFVPKKWKTYILFFAFLSFTSDFTARSNFVRIILALSIMCLYYIKKIVPNITYKLLHFLFFSLPILFFFLAVFNIFNIFKIEDYVKGNFNVESTVSREKLDSDLKADTRTFLYVDVINSISKRKTWLMGEGANGGYETDSFDSLGTRGRMGCEVGILNVLLFLGVFGVLIYSLIFFYASFLAVYYSNSYLLKIIGIFVAFRWTYSWVEEFSDFDMNFFFLWMMIGFCFSKSARKMNDIEIKYWVLGIFERKKSLRQRITESVNQ
jgi:hypothetical protein